MTITIDVNEKGRQPLKKLETQTAGKTSSFTQMVQK